jgi:uncharacterized protein (DUF433 family)
MQDPVTSERLPLAPDANGVIRVAETRITLDTVVAAFEAGATPEQIAQDYPLRLDDIYAVITHYLRHGDEVEAYLAGRRQRTEEVRQEATQRFDQTGVRERLLSRLRKPGG